MCGIFGWCALSDDARMPGSADLGSCLDRLCHRGPDDRGLFVGDGIALGMQRLSIIDIEGGHQPLWNDAGTHGIVYNGELYNFRELRDQLSGMGFSFRTRSDTEVVLHAYERWGPGCLTRFNGMFGLAIWDATDRTLFLARDRIGEKPLYYYVDDDRLVFASEIKAIVQDPTIRREIDQRALVNYLTFGHSVAPETMYRGIVKLLPGHHLVVRGGDVRTASYWDVDGDAEVRIEDPTSEEACARQVRELLDDSVRRRLIADVPVGAFLSGGVDSSAIVALAARHATGPVKTFSVGFTTGGAYNELPDARLVAARLGTEHHELEVGHTDLVDLLQKLVYHYDEPFADPAAFPLYLLSAFAREHVKVALTGDGGDELFGGYRRYATDQLARYAAPVLANGWAGSAADRLPRLRRVKRALDTLPIRDPAERYAAWLVLFSADQRASLLAPDVRAAVGAYDPTAGYGPLYAHLDGGTASDHLNRLMYVDVKTWLADGYMEKTDKASMAAGLEARLPLLDHRLVELAFQIPSRQKIRGWSTKRILKRAVRDLVPAEVLQRRKHGFTVPLDPWFRGELRGFAYEVLLDGTARERGLVDPIVVERLWKEHVEGRNVWDSHLWLLMNLELWCRTYLDGHPTSRDVAVLQP